MKNEKALDAYIATITEINAKLAALTEQTENHLGYSPEEINWGHVGTAKQNEKNEKDQRLSGRPVQ